MAAEVLLEGVRANEAGHATHCTIGITRSDGNTDNTMEERPRSRRRRETIDVGKA